MRSRLELLVPAALLALAACAEHSDTPLAPTAAAFNHVQGCVSVTSHGAQPNDGVDDTWSIQAAVNSSSAVCFPAGVYNVSGSVYLHSNLQIHGEGRDITTIIQSAHATPIFHAWDAAGGSYLYNISIQNLGFQGVGTESGALWIRNVDNVVFQNNRAVNIGLFRSWTDYLAWGNRNIQILDNVAVGDFNGQPDPMRDSGNPQKEAGITVAYAHNVNVYRNDIRNFWSGIQWHGGNANPAYDGAVGNPRRASHIRIEYNTVDSTEAGIWGAMGDSIRVYRNNVRSCVDVCLDAEGSNRVLIGENNARDAGSMVLAVFDYSEGVAFVWNDVRQDGRIWPAYGSHPDWQARRGTTLFSTRSGAPANTRILAANNTFTYEGSTDIGVITKSPAYYYELVNNTMNNVIAELQSNNNGAVVITGNLITLTQTTSGRAGIRSFWNHGAGTANGSYHLQIGGNTINSLSQGSAFGIHVEQVAPGINSWIHDNTVRGFGTSVRTVGSFSSNKFLIQGNKTTTTMSHQGGTLTKTNNVIIL